MSRLVLSSSHKSSLFETQVPKSESECAWPSLIHSMTRVAGSCQASVAAMASPMDGEAALKERLGSPWGRSSQAEGRGGG